MNILSEENQALHTPFLERVLYRKIMRNTEIIEHLHGFIPEYCREIVVHPLLGGGLLTILRDPKLVQGNRVFAIYFNSYEPLYSSHRRSMLEFRVTAWHELIHIMLYVVGYQEHNENKIENAAWHLAYRYPQVLDVLEEFFPGLNFNSIAPGEKMRYPLKLK